MTLLQTHINQLVLRGYRPKSVHSRSYTLRAFEATLPSRNLLKATRLDVEAFLARDLSPATRRSYLQHVRGFYKWCTDEDYLTVDPTAKIKSIRVPKGTPRPIDGTDLIRAISAAPPRMQAWLLLMALAGLRAMEVSALRPTDVIETDAGTLLFLRECKGGGSATVPAHEEVLLALARLQVKDGAWWTCGPHPVCIQTNAYLRSQGIADTAHSLRHYAGTAFYRHSGHDLLATARLLRHVSVQSTEIYAQLDPTRPAEVVRSVPHLRAV